MNILDKIKSVITNVVDFFTGLGFYGLGLLGSGLAVWILFGWSHVGAGLAGAFIFKNFKAIVDSINSLKAKK
jgi:hypothetical protein|tara:strand:- start:240 stop:455 length:216 start_codon:yes stop_codon:yes gene_type:complete